MRTAAAVLLLFATSVDSYAVEKCLGSEGRYFNEALRFHLEARHAPYRTANDVICVGEKHAEDLAYAQRQIDNYFHEVAYKLVDACEERAFMKWAQGAGLRFEVLPVQNNRNEPSGNMFFLRSYTRDEVISNRAKLDGDAPKNAFCNGKK